MSAEDAEGRGELLLSAEDAEGRGELLLSAEDAEGRGGLLLSTEGRGGLLLSTEGRGEYFWFAAGRILVWRRRADEDRSFGRRWLGAVQGAGPQGCVAVGAGGIGESYSKGTEETFSVQRPSAPSITALMR